jgi:hypothetical protein
MLRFLLLALAVTPTLATAQTLASTNGAANRVDSVTRRSETTREASAVRASVTPVLDGRLDENICTDQQKITDFLEYEPTEGVVPRFKTEVCVTYDDKYFYVLARMFDPAPDSIVALLSRRDVRTQSEQLKLVIDSYHDKRTAYQFAVNPVGVKRDFYVYNDDNEDPSWDAVWDVATAIDSLGWTAEFRIPFSQLRFPNRDTHTFGLMIVRDIARTSQRISWPLYSRNKQGYVSQSGEVAGISRIPSPRRLEVAPYVVAKSVTNERQVGDQTDFTHPTLGSYGADIKYGLSSNLTLDATINPDFGQVEADPATLNLTAFETFRGERRPFFLEGTGIFSFRVNCDDIDTGCTGLFYSRRIGKPPTLGGDLGDPTSTTILGASKITGRLGSGLSVGFLDAITQREVGSFGSTIEPQTNYAVARLRQDLNNGRSDIGLMATAVNRELDALVDTILPSEAYAIGIDGRHRFWNNNYEVAGMVSGSTVRGSADAIARIQRNVGVHNYQRPDDDVEYDPTRDRLSGDAQRLSLSKFGGGFTRFQSVFQRYSPGYELNDLGWLQRADEMMFRNWFALTFNNPNRVWRRGQFNFNYGRWWNADWLPLNEWFNTNWHVQLKNQWWLHSGININALRGNRFDDRAARGGPAVLRERRVNWNVGFEGDQRWPVTPFLFVGAWRDDGGRTIGRWAENGYTYRVSTRFSGELWLYYEWQDEDNQWFRNFGDVGSDTTHHTFAQLDQTWAIVTARLNFTATPNLSFQFYAQPYITKGTYSNLRELNDPRAESYDDRYRTFTYDCDGRAPGTQGFTGSCDPLGFDYKELNTNAVVRWEYRPGSAIFLVWQQGRFHSTDRASDFDGMRDFQDLFGLHPRNTFLIKASYWFNY